MWDKRKQFEGGYIIIDHRNSPGLPEDIARQQGIDPAFAGEGKVLEHSTLTCAHCKCAVVKNPLRVRARENCPKCGNHYVCDFCYAKMQHPDYDHTPYEKYIDLTMSGKTASLGSPPQLIIST